MITQHYQIVQCDVCHELKHGGNVTFDEKNHRVESAICDDCNNKEE
jgi:hypothetical protein